MGDTGFTFRQFIPARRIMIVAVAAVFATATMGISVHAQSRDGSSDAKKAPRSPMPPATEGNDTPSLQQVPPTGALKELPSSGIVPPPRTGDEKMEKTPPPTGPNGLPVMPAPNQPGTPRQPLPAPP